MSKSVCVKGMLELPLTLCEFKIESTQHKGVLVRQDFFNTHIFRRLLYEFLLGVEGYVLVHRPIER